MRSTSRSLQGAVAALAAAVVCAGAPAVRASGDGGAPLVLGSASQVRALAPADADRALPLKLRAVVTFVAENHAFLFVQDATDGIFVDTADVPPAGARVGDAALIEGVTAPGLFAPQIRLRRYAGLGAAAPLPPQPATYAELASGKLDSRLVTLQGTVRSIGREPARADGQVRLIFDLVSGGAPFQVRVHLADLAGVAALGGGTLIDATVALTGVCGGIFNGQRQLIGVVLHAPDARAVAVLQPPAARDPFAEPARPLESLFQFSPQGRVNHRLRVDGVVAYHQPGGALYIFDGTSGLSVQTTQMDALAPGDRVQVVGFPAMGEWTPVLEDAVFRRVGAEPPPAPLASTAEREAGADAHDARLVTVEAELLDVVDQHDRLALALRAGTTIFSAEVPAVAGEETFAPPARGSRLSLTGISVARVDKLLKRPTSFKLLLRGPADLVVRSQPPWWTLGRLLAVITGMGAVFALVVVWVMILRRRVRDQTHIIRAQLQHEAALEERYRDLFENANDVVFSQDGEGRLLAINRAAEEITGFRRAELLARTLYDLLPPERREEARRLFARLAAGEEPPPTFETAIVARDGRVIPLEMTVRLTSREGKPVGVEGIARDVSARKRAEGELHAANQRLLDVSRRAGMAEVASSVLHNVGNVLNTVNVSAGLLADRLRASRVPNLGRAVAMLREGESGAHGGGKGGQVVSYLEELAAHMAAEQQALLGEVEALGASVEHIKEIVAMQQGYARATGGVQETLPASALVADALRMNGEPAARAGVQVASEIAADPEITVEKHKVLQILVNLISNAENACAAAAAGDGAAAARVLVRVEAAGRTRVRFSVSDNGVGIAPENLTRIFQHGFTTRKEGHGFGLHSAALTARELGGSLAAVSAGPGRGATFTLELPVSPEHGDKRTTKERLKIIHDRV